MHISFSPRSSTLLIVMAALLALPWTSGCATDLTCDPGQELRRGLCYPIVPDAAAPADATTDDAANDAAECGDAGTGMLGDPCTDNVNHGECSCSAPYCAISPGMTEGICTVTGCVDVPERCPSGYRCFDPSVFGSDAPSVCVPE